MKAFLFFLFLDITIVYIFILKGQVGLEFGLENNSALRLMQKASH